MLRSTLSVQSKGQHLNRCSCRNAVFVIVFKTHICIQAYYLCFLYTRDVSAGSEYWENTFYQQSSVEARQYGTMSSCM